MTDAQRAALQAVVPLAEKYHRLYGVWASIQLAQWILKSGWGRRDLGVFNYFGMKHPSGSPRPYVVRKTREFRGGRWVEERARFLAFPDADAAFEAHARLLVRGKSYEPFRKAATADAAAGALAGVYATDPRYASKLTELMRELDLYQYDGPATGRGPTSQ